MPMTRIPDSIPRTTLNIEQYSIIITPQKPTYNCKASVISVSAHSSALKITDPTTVVVGLVIS
jgi:hypothetical protein